METIKQMDEEISGLHGRIISLEGMVRALAEASGYEFGQTRSPTGITSAPFIFRWKAFKT